MENMKDAKLAINEPTEEFTSASEGAIGQNGATGVSDSLGKHGVDKHIGKLNSKVNILLVDDRKDKLLALGAILTPLGQKPGRSAFGQGRAAAAVEE